MVHATLYPAANHTAQWYARTYPGRTFTGIDRLVLHTTEVNGWPGYSGGSEAPNLTLWARNGVVEVRQHFPVNMSSRALVHTTGQVDTNNLNAVQIELVGTCVRGGPGLYWPGAPTYALQGLANVIRFLVDEWALPTSYPALWLPYPQSAGASRARMSAATWRAFHGICGHEHVPENDHGDPGDLPLSTIVSLAGVKEDGELPYSEADLSRIMVAAIESEKDEIAKDVWNRFVVRDTAGNPTVHLIEVMQGMYDFLHSPAAAPVDVPALATSIQGSLAAYFTAHPVVATGGTVSLSDADVARLAQSAAVATAAELAKRLTA